MKARNLNSSRFTLIAVQKSRHSHRVLHGSLPLPSLLLLLTMTLLADFSTDSLTPLPLPLPPRCSRVPAILADRGYGGPFRFLVSAPAGRFCPRPLSRVHNARNFDIYWARSSFDVFKLHSTRARARAVALSRIDKISTSTSLHHPLGMKTFLLFAAKLRVLEAT